MRNGATKLTVRLVQEIRELYEVQGLSQGKLARRFGMSIGQIGRVVRYESWGGVKPGLTGPDLEAIGQRVMAEQRAVDDRMRLADVPLPPPPTMLPQLDVPITKEVAARAAAFGAKTPVSPLNGGEALDDITEGAGLQRLGEEIKASPNTLLEEMKKGEQE